MARSTYIYVVLNGDIPVAACTVKRELVWWLKRERQSPDGDRTRFYTVYRMEDGYSARGGTRLDMEELLAS